MTLTPCFIADWKRRETRLRSSQSRSFQQREVSGRCRFERTHWTLFSGRCLSRTGHRDERQMDVVHCVEAEFQSHCKDFVISHLLLPCGVCVMLTPNIYEYDRQLYSQRFFLCTFQVSGSQDGTITCNNLIFSTVHGLYRDRYAYRQNLTDLVVQLLSAVDVDDTSSGSKIFLRCHDLIKKISIYKDKLAVSEKAKSWRRCFCSNLQDTFLDIEIRAICKSFPAAVS